MIALIHAAVDKCHNAQNGENQKRRRHHQQPWRVERVGVRPKKMSVSEEGHSDQTK
jgi:hypothetical protein